MWPGERNTRILADLSSLFFIVVSKMGMNI